MLVSWTLCSTNESYRGQWHREGGGLEPGTERPKRRRQGDLPQRRRRADRRRGHADGHRGGAQERRGRAQERRGRAQERHGRAEERHGRAAERRTRVDARTTQESRQRHAAAFGRKDSCNMGGFREDLWADEDNPFLRFQATQHLYRQHAAEKLRVWPKDAVAVSRQPCLLCSADFDDRPALLEHVRTVHGGLQRYTGMQCWR